jgi:NADPH:quinone reductase-like Zn-dependent oxidoreductase
MRAVAIDAFGQTPAVQELPLPVPGPGELLVRVQSSSVNGFDLAVASGMIKDLMPHAFPLVLGRDFAGVVEATGPNVSGFSVGDVVFGVVLKPVLQDGAFGEYVTVPESFGVTKVPNEVDIPLAGALGLAGVAALMSVDAVAPGAGETVLISGATGGVGAYATQLVRARGAEVIATAKPGEEEAFVRELGAAHAVDYSGDVTDGVRALCPEGVDAVIHLAGDARRLVDALKPGGRYASTLLFSPEMSAGWPVSVVSVTASPDGERLAYLAHEVAAQRLRVAIQRSYALDEIPQGFADFAAGTCGKLAVTIG